MRAALIREVGGSAEVGEVTDPDGELIEVLAAPINPIDIAISRGVLATGHPELPYVPGCEAVGRRSDGQLVWIFGGSLGRTSAGAIALAATTGARLSEYLGLVWPPPGPAMSAHVAILAPQHHRSIRRARTWGS